MSWVHKAPPPSERHECKPPTRVRGFVINPDGARRDLWRCDDCRSLWRVGLACAVCDHYGDRPHLGSHTVGTEWRPATLWQRIRHARRGHPQQDDPAETAEWERSKET